MKKSIGQLVLLIVAITVTKPISIHGQDFFRDFGTSRSSGGFGPVTPSEYSYEDASPSGMRPLRSSQDLSIPEEAEEADKYNFAIGDIRFGMAVGAGIEYNDNITLSDKHRISD